MSGGRGAVAAGTTGGTTPLFEHDLDLCMRCSACAATCPTYGVLGHEGFSPRGRVQVAGALLEGRLEPNPRSLEFLDTCLHCEACRTACPNDVPVTRLVDLALDLPDFKPLGPAPNRAVRLMLWAVAHPWTLALLRPGLWLWQRLRLGRLAKSAGHRVPWLASLAEVAAGLPPMPSPFRPALPARHAPALPAPLAPARRLQAGSGRVAFFLGCVQEAVFAETNRASISLLQAAGLEVASAPGQGCCGALHLHQGRVNDARSMARRNIAAFEAAGPEWVVNSAGGCGATLREYGSLLAGDPEWASRAAAFSSRVRDISDFLAGLPLSGGEGGTGRDGPEPHRPRSTPLPLRVTIQDSCHLVHVQGVRSPLRTLLTPVAGRGLVELPRPDQCCGSAGVYNLERTELALAILDRKMEDVKSTGADVVVTANPGCTLQLRLGVARAGLTGQVRVLHVADLLWESVRPTESERKGGGSRG